LPTFTGLWGLALTVFVAMEIHKWTWAMRDRYTAASTEPNGGRNDSKQRESEH
jgi:hypothetical protein